MNFITSLVNHSFFRFPVIFVCAGVLFFCQNAEPGKNKLASEKQDVTKAAQAAPVTAGNPANSHDTAAGKSSVSEQWKLIVYYFHGNMRCHTCYNLENYAKQVVETNFAEAIKNGRLEWKTVNVETAGNEHFSNDYKLYTKSVIVSTVKKGKEVSWKNLDQIWQLVRDETKYKEYISREVKACLDGKCL